MEHSGLQTEELSLPDVGKSVDGFFYYGKPSAEAFFSILTRYDDIVRGVRNVSRWWEIFPGDSLPAKSEVYPVLENAVSDLLAQYLARYVGAVLERYHSADASVRIELEKQRASLCVLAQEAYSVYRVIPQRDEERGLKQFFSSCLSANMARLQNIVREKFKRLQSSFEEEQTSADVRSLLISIFSSSVLQAKRFVETFEAPLEFAVGGRDMSISIEDVQTGGPVTAFFGSLKKQLHALAVQLDQGNDKLTLSSLEKSIASLS